MKHIINLIITISLVLATFAAGYAAYIQPKEGWGVAGIPLTILWILWIIYLNDTYN